MQIVSCFDSRMPRFRLRPYPMLCGLLTTRAPAASASSAVRSLEPSFTTRTSKPEIAAADITF